MHRRITQYPTSCKKSRIQYQYKTGDGCQNSSLHVNAFVFGNQHEVTCCNQGKPGDQGCIFHRIPSPEPTEVQCFIGPGATHQYTTTQNRNSCKRPGCSWFHPLIQFPGP